MKFDTITDLGNLQKDNLSVKAQISCLCTDYPSVKGMFEAVKIPIITKFSGKMRFLHSVSALGYYDICLSCIEAPQ